MSDAPPNPWITAHLHLLAKPASWKAFGHDILAPALLPIGITANIIDATDPHGYRLRLLENQVYSSGFPLIAPPLHEKRDLAWTAHVFEQVITPEEVDTEDQGQAKIVSLENSHPDFFVRLQSWSDTGAHTTFNELVGKRVRVTVEVIE